MGKTGKKLRRNSKFYYRVKENSMGYPYGKTYLRQIQENPTECKTIEEAFYILRKRAERSHGGEDIELSISEQFYILGEAFDLASVTLDGCTDEYHFLQDVVKELLTPKEKTDEDHSLV